LLKAHCQSNAGLHMAAISLCCSVELYLFYMKPLEYAIQTYVLPIPIFIVSRCSASPALRDLLRFSAGVATPGKQPFRPPRCLLAAFWEIQLTCHARASASDWIALSWLLHAFIVSRNVTSLVAAWSRSLSARVYEESTGIVRKRSIVSRPTYHK
jgi:hypothetical protein